MSFTAADLQAHVNSLLRDLGYTFRREGSDGWVWSFGVMATGTTRPAVTLEAAKATAQAVSDLVGCVDDLLDTGRSVIENAKSASSAEALAEFAGAVGMLNPLYPTEAPAAHTGERRRERLRRLVRDGLTLEECLAVFRELESP